MTPNDLRSARALDERFAPIRSALSQVTVSLGQVATCCGMPHRSAVRSFGAAALCVVSAMPRVAAQSPTGIAAVDSARVARAAWQRAVSAFNAKDIGVARREVDHAATAWPV